MEQQTASSVVSASKPPLAVSITYRFLSIGFFAIGILNFFVSMSRFAKQSTQVGTLFLGYAAFAFIFAFGMWGYKKWMVAATAINLFGIVVLKIYYALYGGWNMWNIITSIAIAAGLLGLTYGTRNYLKGRLVEPIPITILVLIWLLVSQNSAIL